MLMLRALLPAVSLLLVTAATGAPITGRVFSDRNGDRKVSPGEPGLPGAVVSDGRSVVTTSAAGEYTIDAEGSPYVFVSLPRGWRAADRLYYGVDAGPRIDFALVEWPESARDDVRFIQISDTHVTDVPDTLSTFIADIEEMNRLEPRAAFVLATGDLVSRAEREVELKNYVTGTGHFRIPLFNLPGNHDAYSELSLGHYHRYVGPDYYSFNVGNCHFVMLNSMRIRESVQREWIEKDLAAAPKGATRIFAFHHLPTTDDMKLLTSLGAAAVLSGHWHGNRARRSEGLFDLNTPPLRFGGIDRHPRGFRILDVRAGEVVNELRLGGFRDHAVIVAPQGESPAREGRVQVVVNAYHTSQDIAGVECEVAGRIVALEKKSPWSWVGSIDLRGRENGEHTLTATIRAGNGATWQDRSTFRVVRDSARAADPPSLQFKWAAPTGGLVALSSPQAGRDGIVIGLDDQGDLKHCGVSAFDRHGRLLWHHPTDSAIKNDIAIADGRVFATSVAGWVYALDEKTGRQLWKAGLDQARARWEVAATTAAEGLVFAGSPSYMAAFDPASGRQLWGERYGADRDWTPKAYPIPRVADGRVIVNGERHGTVARDTRSGKLIWDTDTLTSRLSAAGEVMYTVKNSDLHALRAADGKVLWNKPLGFAASASAPVVAGDRILMGTANGRVCALAKADGALLWTFQAGASLTSLEPYRRGGSDVNSTPAIAGDTVYVGASDGVLYALSLANGEKVGSYRLGVPIASSPLIERDTLYVAAYDGNLYAFSIAP